MSIESFIAGFRAAARVAIELAESIQQEAPYVFDQAPTRAATALEREERKLRAILAAEDPYAPYRDFLTY